MRSTIQRCRPSGALLSNPRRAIRVASALLQGTPAAGKVVTLVPMQPIFVFTITNYSNPKQPDEHRPAARMPSNCVGSDSPNRDGQLNTSRIYDNVSFRPELTSVRRIEAVSRPRELGTLATSSLARSLLIGSCSRNRRSVARCSVSHTPALCQSRSRRQHVMPLPKASSLPTECLSTRHSGRRSMLQVIHRASAAIFGEGVNTGISGSSAADNSLLSLRLVMLQEYGAQGLTSGLC